MDEYCLMPTKLAQQHLQSKVVVQPKLPDEGRQPPDSKDVLSLDGLVGRICRRKDVNDWEKADMLSLAITKFLSFRGDPVHNPVALVIPQNVKEEQVLPASSQRRIKNEETMDTDTTGQKRSMVDSGATTSKRKPFINTELEGLSIEKLHGELEAVIPKKEKATVRTMKQEEVMDTDTTGQKRSDEELLSYEQLMEQPLRKKPGVKKQKTGEHYVLSKGLTRHNIRKKLNKTGGPPPKKLRTEAVLKTQSGGSRWITLY